MTSAPGPVLSARRANLVIVCIALLTAGGVFTIRPLLSYRIIELGLDRAWIGIVGSAYAIAPLVAAPVLGDLSDRWGARRSLVTGTTTMTLGSLVLIWAMSPLTLLAGVIVLGFGHFLALVGLQMAASSYGRASGRMQQSFSTLSLAMSVGHILGPGLMGLAGGSAAVPPTMEILVILTIGLAACPLLGLLWVRSPTTGSAPVSTTTWSAIVRIPKLARVVTISGLVVAAIDLTGIFLPLLGSERGLSSGFVGALLVTRAVFSALIRVVINGLILRVGAERVAMVGLAVATVAMCAVALPLHSALMVVAMAVLGASLGVADPITGAWSAQLAPLEAQGRAASFRIMANRAGQVVVPLVAAGIAPLLGAAGGFWLVAVCLGAASRLSHRASPG